MLLSYEYHDLKLAFTYIWMKSLNHLNAEHKSDFFFSNSTWLISVSHAEFKRKVKFNLLIHSWTIVLKSILNEVPGVLASKINEF